MTLGRRRLFWWSILVGVVWVSNSVSADTSEIVVIRQPGRPELRVVVEQSTQQADGGMVHVVRNVETGERFRVVDVRTSRTGAGPMLGSLFSRIGTNADEQMSRALAGSPAAHAPARRSPTNVELAVGSVASPKSIAANPKKPATKSEISPADAQIAQLKDGSTPAQRESAAIALAMGDHRTRPEVVLALDRSARSDPSASVRACGIRCLFQISREVPEVLPTIRSLQTDPSVVVSQTARMVIEQINRR